MTQTTPQVAPQDEILEQARAMGMTNARNKDLPRPEGLPLDGYYNVNRRKVGGAVYLYLFYRWRDEAGRIRAKSLGRLD